MLDYEYEFRRLQESRRNPVSGTEPELYYSGSKRLDDSSRTSLAATYERFLSGSLGQIAGNGVRLTCEKHGTSFQILRVPSQVFHDILEVSRSFLKNGELVDLHEDYSECKCFLTKDGFAGFAIEPNGNLISVFSLYGRFKPGFLYSIKDFAIEQGATHCDCYDSWKQPLSEMYQKILGFQEASRMKYNLSFDHDVIAEKHRNPDVVFMVCSQQKVSLKLFNENQYDEAKSYQMRCVHQASRQNLIKKDIEQWKRILQSLVNTSKNKIKLTK